MDLLKRSKAKGDRLQNVRGRRLYTQLLSNATHGLTFSEDVMRELGPEGIPYSKADFRWLFHASGPLAPVTRLKNRRAGGVKGIPLCTTPQTPEEGRGPKDFHSPLPPLQSPHINPLTAKESFTLPSHQGGMLDAFKRTGLRGVSNVYSCLKEVSAGDREDRTNSCRWDEFMLKKLTKTTAQWIVSQQIPNQSQKKSALKSLLTSQYGSANATDLVREDPMCEDDFCSYQEAGKPTSEQKAFKSSKAETPLPAYYRVQGYVRTPARIDEPGGLNQTVNTVRIAHAESPQPPRLQDSLNPRAGRHVFRTENNFELELFSGIAKPVHQCNTRNRDRIIMDNHSEYGKNLQELFPCGPEKWTKAAEETRDMKTEGMGRIERGARRWVDLPTKADYITEVGIRPPDYSWQDMEVPRQQPHYNPMPELSSLRYAVEEWRGAWKIKTTWQSVTIEGLKKALTDLHYHVRLGAIATCASGAVNRPREEQDPTDAGYYGRSWAVEPVPQELQPLLLSALDDPIRRVQMAAAVCQYAMGTPNARARDILRYALNRDSAGIGADSWVAAQCLAMEGEASRAVIQRLLSQHFLSKAQTDKEQAAALLASVSSKTTLVRSLLAEELNCANWRTRVLACKSISQLRGPINKDLANKLIYLMWNDWSSKVRQTAAQALGKLGMGRDVHNELRVKLDEGTPSWRVDALVLVAQLQIMTAKLLPAFLRCLGDDFVAVRKQACQTAATLAIQDQAVLNQLIQLMQNDPAWEVKVLAIDALGKIGCLSANLQELLLWALHHEEEPCVRVAACEALAALGVKGPELQQLLQERFVLDTDARVHRHIEGLLRNYGYSLEGDKGMVHKIRDQVQKLCTKRIITEKLQLMEKLVGLQQQQRFLGYEDQTETSVIPKVLPERFKGCQHSPPTVKQSLTMDDHASEIPALPLDAPRLLIMNSQPPSHVTVERWTELLAKNDSLENC